MSTTEIQYNISGQTCRVCLETPEPNEGEVFLCLQDEIEYNDLKVELWQLLEAVSKVKCTWYDSLWPTQMCQSCTRRLILAYEFMREVEKSQQILQELYEHEKLRQGVDIQETPKEDVLQMLEIDDEDIRKTLIESNIVFKNVEPNNFDENLLQISEAAQEENEREQEVGVGENSPLATSQNFIFKSQFCTEVVAESESLEHHMGTTHSQTGNVAEELDQQSIGSGLLTCKHCPRNFKRQDGLRRHVIAFHPGECAETNNDQGSSNEKASERISECTMCSKRFISQNRLARHMRVHSKQRPYAYETTNKSFVQFNHQKNHKLKHEEERPFQCLVCCESFVCRSLLNIHCNQKGHQEVETQDPVNVLNVLGIEKPHPYKCGVCGMNFKSGALLTVHRNNLSHYNNEEVNYGDPFKGRCKKLQQDNNKDAILTLS